MELCSPNNLAYQNGEFSCETTEEIDDRWATLGTTREIVAAECDGIGGTKCAATVLITRTVLFGANERIGKARISALTYPQNRVVKFPNNPCVPATGTRDGICYTEYVILLMPVPLILISN